jgi:hypothetical protein
MSELNPLGAFTKGKLGQRVDRDTDNILTGENLFTIAGGRVLVTQIVGEVTTIMETKTINFKLTSDPDVGTTNDMCANLDLTAAEVGTLLTISGTAADALRAGKSGSVTAQNVPMIVAAGAIEATVGATHTGSIKWSIWYMPLDDGAYVEAA